MQVTRGINEAEQLATTPFLRTAVMEANKSYAGKDARGIESIIQDWQKEWRKRGWREQAGRKGVTLRRVRP